MSAEDYTERFEAAITAWREKHKLREDDAIFLCVDLFRIHQEHWDELRRAEMPSLTRFQPDIAKFAEINNAFQRQAHSFLEQLRRCEPHARQSGISFSAVLVIFLCALAAGFCMGKAFL